MKRIPANSAPLAATQPAPRGDRSEDDVPDTACGAVVEMVNVAVPLVVVLSRTTELVEPNEHVINAEDAGGVQVRSTVPLNPFVAVTVTIDVPGCPGEATVTGLPPTENPGVTTKPGHDVTSTLVSTEPSPVTRSYPAPALYPI